MSKKQELLASCKVQPYDIHRFLLLEDFTYEGITVPKGYITNGADTPRLLWFIYPPNRPDYLPAVILHDYLCDKEEYKLADKLFKFCLRDLEVHPSTIFIFHKGVVTFHYVKYHIPNKLKRNK